MVFYKIYVCVSKNCSNTEQYTIRTFLRESKLCYFWSKPCPLKLSTLTGQWAQIRLPISHLFKVAVA